MKISNKDGKTYFSKLFQVHSTGDSLLMNTRKILQSIFDSEHIVVRNGEDEFVVIMKNKPYLEVERLYGKL